VPSKKKKKFKTVKRVNLEKGIPKSGVNSLGTTTKDKKTDRQKTWCGAHCPNISIRAKLWWGGLFGKKKGPGEGQDAKKKRWSEFRTENESAKAF